MNDLQGPRGSSHVPWQGQRLDPLYHRREEASRWLALSQQKLIISGMYNQPADGLH